MNRIVVLAALTAPLSLPRALPSPARPVTLPGPLPASSVEVYRLPGPAVEPLLVGAASARRPSGARSAWSAEASRAALDRVFDGKASFLIVDDTDTYTVPEQQLEREIGRR